MIRVGCFRCGLIRRLIWERSRRGGLNLMVSGIRIMVCRWGIRMLTGGGGRVGRFRWGGGGGGGGGGFGVGFWVGRYGREFSYGMRGGDVLGSVRYAEDDGWAVHDPRLTAAVAGWVGRGDRGVYLAFQ